MKKIKFNKPYIIGTELNRIKEVFDNEVFYGSGKFTKSSECLISEHLSSKNVLLTDSCSSALDMVGILLRDHSKTQEIIMPSYTFTSTANAFVKLGFKVKFVEIMRDNLTIDPEAVKANINENTCAIVAVHYGSHIADLEALKDISTLNNVFLIEDAAQAYFSKFKNSAVGTFGDFGCFSFHETKNIHCGLGGALTVKNNDYYESLRMIWERGTDRQNVLRGKADKYTWRIAGGSYYPTELQAAFLYEQLNNIDKNIAERKEIYTLYRENLKHLKGEGVLFFPDFPDEYESNYHSFYIIDLKDGDSEKLRRFLLSKNIDSFIGYVPLHSSPMGINLGNLETDLPLTNQLSKAVLRLPFHNDLSEDNVLEITNYIAKFYEI